MSAARVESSQADTDKSTRQKPPARLRRVPPGLAWATVGGAVLFQAYAYYFKLQLSLGPRVILAPWLLRHGFVLYQTMVDIHAPLMSLLLAALSSVVPDGLTLAKLVLVALLSTTTLLTFLATKRHAGWVAGIWAVFWFALWSPRFEFGKLWYESFLAPIYLVFFLIYRPSARSWAPRSCVLVGVLAGAAVLIKQHAAVMFVAFLVWHAFTGIHLKRARRSVLREVLVMGLASAVPVMAFAAYQAVTAGTLSGFLYWTVGYEVTGVYNRFASQVPTVSQIVTLASCAFLLPAALIALVEQKRDGDERWMVVAWGLILAAAGSLMAYPRFELFHLQPALPVLVVVCSIGLAHLARVRNGHRRFTIAIPLVVAVLWVLTAGRAYNPVLERDTKRRIVQYSDLESTAHAIRRTIGSSDSIYIVPDDEVTSNLYYLLGCRPPGFWTFHYPWMMVDRVKTRIASLFEKNPPRWVVYSPGRWDIQKSGPEMISRIQGSYREVTSVGSPAGQLLLMERR
jgi:hypothetical protein